MPKLPDNWRQPITTLDEGKAALDSLIAAGMSYHLDDDPGDIIHSKSGENLFYRRDVPTVRRRVRELFALDWGAHECPIGYTLDVETPGWRDKYDEPEMSPESQDLAAAGWTVTNSHGADLADGSRSFYVKDPDGGCYGDFATEQEAWSAAPGFASAAQKEA